jgi:dolichyl-phosphate beta-glucosyltransferase
MLSISIIIPAYNESARLPSTLKVCLKYLTKKDWDWEIIIIDDGSKDQTIETVQPIIKDYPVQTIILPENQGKGAAIGYGIRKTTKDWSLLFDADNATPLDQIEKLLPFIDRYQMIIGSRYLNHQSIKIKQPFYRVLIGRLGNILIQALLLPKIKDTQCGFKLIKTTLAQKIFNQMTIKRWGFDMELLAIGKYWGYKIKEIPVDWFDSGESRLRPVKATFNTLRELIKIKTNIIKGKYNKTQN